MTAGAGRANGVILTLHVAALMAGLGFAWSQWSDLMAQRATVEQARETLGQLDARLAGRGPPAAPAGPPAADPFLAGPSATVAGANLQDRVVSAIRGAGGTVTSSQLDATGITAVPPVMSLTVSCQVANEALQGLLYGLESGTPALFLDQLSIDAAEPDGRGGGPGGPAPLKVAMTVSAYWAGDGKP